jgi:phospholipid/cholesterol/gamma-HCH transport system substrate-binding protein
MKNIEEITDKINSGKGTIGKLINDEKTVDELNTAIQGVSEFVGTASKTTTHLDFHTEYLGDVGEAKSYLGVRLQPGLDRYYELQIVDDPKGVVKETTTETTTGGTTTVEDEKKTYKNKIKFTALFCKKFL